MILCLCIIALAPSSPSYGSPGVSSSLSVCTSLHHLSALNTSRSHTDTACIICMSYNRPCACVQFAVFWDLLGLSRSQS